MQVCDWAGEAGRAERSGAAHPADAGAGTLAAGDDGAALQPIHGRAGGGCSCCDRGGGLQVSAAWSASPQACSGAGVTPPSYSQRSSASGRYGLQKVSHRAVVPSSCVCTGSFRPSKRDHSDEKHTLVMLSCGRPADKLLYDGGRVTPRRNPNSLTAAASVWCRCDLSSKMGTNQDGSSPPSSFVNPRVCRILSLFPLHTSTQASGQQAGSGGRAVGLSDTGSAPSSAHLVSVHGNLTSVLCSLGL